MRAEQNLRNSRDELDYRVRLRTQELMRSNELLEEEVAERQKTEKELQLTNTTLNNLIETSPLAICAFNNDGTVRRRNAAAEKILRDDPSGIRPLIDSAARGESVAGVELVQELAGSGPKHLHVWVSPLPTLDGSSAGGVLLIAVDVSERKAFEAQLRETQKLESLGVLAGGIAHDFNNLLTGIMGNVSLAADTLDPGDPGQTFLSHALTATERAADLTRQLLAYAGKGPICSRKNQRVRKGSRDRRTDSDVDSQDCSVAPRSGSGNSEHRSRCQPDPAGDHESGDQRI